MKKITTTVICLVLAIFSPSAASLATANSSSCSADPTQLERLSAQLKDAVDCIETLADQWGRNQSASLMDSLRRATNRLQKHQKTVCSRTTPKQCPDPVIPSKGGLLCVTIGDARYCKPMCNEGYDFDFLRRSRLYEQCNKSNGYKWTTQYVGGNRLAICNKSAIQVSGAKTAYFPKDQDCLETKSQTSLERELIQVFVSELQSQGVQGNTEFECLICG